jgi:hypothetical protein
MNRGAARAADVTDILPKGFWLARAITFTAGLGLQSVGLYAAVATFGAWVTVGLYAVGGLAIVLQHITRRRTPCSPGEL